MTDPSETTIEQPASNARRQAARRRRLLTLAAPGYIAVPLAFGLWFHHLGGPLPWSAFGLGALGWWVALLLRAPLAPVAARLGPERGRTLVILASGPLEELVRLGMLRITGAALAPALSLGLGWGTIEVIFTLVNAFVLVHLLQRDDERARAAREQIERLGLPLDASPAWGILERISATALHVGFTLLVARSPYFVLVTIPLHSAVNLLASRHVRRLVLMESMLGAVATAVLAAGLWAAGVF